MRRLKLITFLALAVAWQGCFGQNAVYFREVTRESIRALEVYSEAVIWFGASGGAWGFTNDGGRTWTTGRIEEADSLDFRSLAVLDAETALLLTAGSPARMFKTEDAGRTWKKVFEDKSEGVFFDSMTFRDHNNGIAFGDPLNGCFYIILTSDGGETWRRVPCRDLPLPVEGEAAFASSNTCISVYRNHTWIATGGKVSRVLHSADNGKNWEAAATPVVQGGKMTGIYSVDFYDSETGVFVGGDYEAQNIDTGNKGVSKDGGKTWRLTADGRPPGYQSCVQFIPGSGGKKLISAGHGGLFLSRDGARTWENVEKGTFTTVRLGPGGETAWFAGKGFIGKISLRAKKAAGSKSSGKNDR